MTLNLRPVLSDLIKPFGYLEELGFLFKIKERMKILPQAYR